MLVPPCVLSKRLEDSEQNDRVVPVSEGVHRAQMVLVHGLASAAGTVRRQRRTDRCVAAVEQRAHIEARITPTYRSSDRLRESGRHGWRERWQNVTAVGRSRAE